MQEENATPAQTAEQRGHAILDRRQEVEKLTSEVEQSFLSNWSVLGWAILWLFASTWLLPKEQWPMAIVFFLLVWGAAHAVDNASIKRATARERLRDLLSDRNL